MTTLRLKLFGRQQIAYADRPLSSLPAKAQELLFFLVTHVHSFHSRESITELLWPHQNDGQGKNYLRKKLWQLNSALDVAPDDPDSPVIADEHWVSLNPQADVWSDAQLLRQVHSLACEKRVSDLDTDFVRTVQEALNLYENGLLNGWYQDWCIFERERYRSIFLILADRLIDYFLLRNQFERGIDLSFQLLHYDGTREKTHRRLMRLYYGSGDRTGALHQFDQCAAILSNELDVPPSRRTIGLYKSILNETDELLAQGQDSNHYGQMPPQPNQKEADNEKEAPFHQILVELKTLRAECDEIKRDLSTLMEVIGQNQSEKTHEDTHRDTHQGTP